MFTVKDNCASSPCKNGAKCTSSLGKFTCSCVDGYTGDDCGSGKYVCYTRIIQTIYVFQYNISGQV